MTASGVRVLPPELAFDLEAATCRIVGFLRDRLDAAGLATYVLGLSGGVDSACAAALAVRAIGSDHLLTVKLPSRSSSSASRADAELVEDALGIPTERRLLIEIGPMVHGWLAGTGERAPHPLRMGNVAARCRMVVLWDLAMKHHGVVLGTENRTESLLGYFTIYGDAGTAVEPIPALYKSQVWALAAHLGVPEQVVSKDPTADLWDGQTDEGELGLRYTDADQVLYWAVDRGLSAAGVATRTGLREPEVARVLERHRATAFKHELPYRLTSDAVRGSAGP